MNIPGCSSYPIFVHSVTCIVETNTTINRRTVLCNNWEGGYLLHCFHDSLLSDLAYWAVWKQSESKFFFFFQNVAWRVTVRRDFTANVINHASIFQHSYFYFVNHPPPSHHPELLTSLSMFSMVCLSLGGIQSNRGEQVTSHSCMVY